MRIGYTSAATHIAREAQATRTGASQMHSHKHFVRYLNRVRHLVRNQGVFKLVVSCRLPRILWLCHRFSGSIAGRK